MLPIGDWQFWVATTAVAVVVALGVRAAWPRARGRKRARLTVEGRECKH